MWIAWYFSIIREDDRRTYRGGAYILPHFSHSVRDVSRRSDCPAAEALFRKRIAKLPSYCRIMHTIHKNELPRMGAQGESRHGRRVSTVLSGIEALKSIIRTVSWQHSVANERTPLLQGSHSGGLRPTFICCPYIALCYANWLL